MKKLEKSLALLALLVTVSCEKPEKKLVAEQQEAEKEISKAEQELAETKIDGNKKIADSSLENLEEEKIEATREISAAERKVDDEKIEGSKEVEKARQVVEPAGSYKKE